MTDFKIFLSNVAWAGFLVGLVGLLGIFAGGLSGSVCLKECAKLIFFLGFVPMMLALAVWMVVHHLRLK